MRQQPSLLLSSLPVLLPVVIRLVIEKKLEHALRSELGTCHLACCCSQVSSMVQKEIYVGSHFDVLFWLPSFDSGRCATLAAFPFCFMIFIMQRMLRSGGQEIDLDLGTSMQETRWNRHVWNFEFMVTRLRESAHSRTRLSSSLRVPYLSSIASVPIICRSYIVMQVSFLLQRLCLLVVHLRSSHQATFRIHLLPGQHILDSGAYAEKR